MKFYLDENLPAPLSKSLASLIGQGHRFYDYRDQGTQGVLDVPLIEHLQVLAFDAIITKDINQLGNLEEHDALRAAGLHWIGLDLPKLEGLTEIRATVGTLLGGLPYVIHHWAEKPSSYVFRVHPKGWEPPAVTAL